MDWVTVLWSSVAGACLMLALVHLVIWCRARSSWASLWFCLTAFSVVGVMVCEMVIMHAERTATAGSAVRWTHLIYLFITLGILGFVHSYFGTGRRWIFGLALGLRILAVVANFTTGSSLHFKAIHSLTKIPFLGESVSVPWVVEENPWIRLGQFSSLVLLSYVLDASLSLWRRGAPEQRRKVILLGGGLAFFIVLAPLLPILVIHGILRIPLNASLPFLGMLLAMNYELSRDVLRAASLARDLEIHKERLSLAAAAGRLAMWEWDLSSGRIWVSDEGRRLYGVPASDEVNLDLFVATLYPEDRARVIRAMEESLTSTRPYAEEYRVMLPDGSIRWIAATGRLERDDRGQAVLMRGVSQDFTDRKHAEIQTEVQRRELAHLSRVSLLGEMAGTLAHELNQPLAAMLSNSQVGRRSIDAGHPDLTEMAEILDDITADAKRAGGIIHGMRAMLKKDPVAEPQILDPNEIVHQVLELLRGEITARRQNVNVELSGNLPTVRADRVEFQQVLINLVINGLDAMGPESGGLTVRTATVGDRVEVAVHDSGLGIPPEAADRLFDAFFSTKPGGLGLGLPISRGIVERFGGELLAENHPQGGAEFRILLPISR